MISSLKGAGLLKLTRNNGPVSQGLSSQAGPEEMSLAPGGHEINTGALARSPCPARGPRKAAGTQPFCSENPGSPGGGGFGFQHL